MPSELTRQSRRAAAERLDALAAEISDAAGWLDQLSDDHLADRASRLLECGSRDLLAASWLLHRGAEPLPDRWLQASQNGR